MENESRQKSEWQKPELTDLDVKNTLSGLNTTTGEYLFYANNS